MVNTSDLINNAHRLLGANITRPEQDRAAALTALANATAQDRIATALERVATALETLAADTTPAGITVQPAIRHTA